MNLWLHWTICQSSCSKTFNVFVKFCDSTVLFILFVYYCYAIINSDDSCFGHCFTVHCYGQIMKFLCCDMLNDWMHQCMFNRIELIENINYNCLNVTISVCSLCDISSDDLIDIWNAEVQYQYSMLSTSTLCIYWKFVWTAT